MVNTYLMHKVKTLLQVFVHQNQFQNLKKDNPALYEEFLLFLRKLEAHYRDMQDMEFTIERGKLYMLQTRNGKRTAQAALKIAIDLVKEGVLTEKEAF
jgi:pyruvate, orthophosphate dikinase